MVKIPKEVIDLFSGAGGFSEGFRQAGFKILYANEISKDASKTYKHNHPNTFVDTRDIRKLTAKDILSITKKKPDIIIGGPPCQGFSTLGKRDPNDPRSTLVNHFVSLVLDIKPRFFLMENVPGIASISNGNLFKKVLKKFENEGYLVSCRILDSSQFGVPQSRKRMFVFGDLKGKKSLDDAKFSERPITSTKQALEDLNFINSGEDAKNYKRFPRTTYQKEMRKHSENLHNHKSSSHKESTIKRFSFIPPGGDVSSIPKSHKTKKGVLFRLDPIRPSRTITTLPDDIIHYSSNRILTVREMARLQSFGDHYTFLGKRTTGGTNRRSECPQYTQVGNAVPPLMAKAVAEWISN